MKRVLMIIAVLVIVPVPASVQGKTRTYADGWIRVTTHRSPSYRYDRSGTTIYDEKEGVYIKRDYTLRDALFGGGDSQNDQVLAISRESRQQESKMSFEEMNELAKRIKAKQQQSVSSQGALSEEIKQLRSEIQVVLAENERLRKENAELHKKLDEIIKALQAQSKK